MCYADRIEVVIRYIGRIMMQRNVERSTSPRCGGRHHLQASASSLLEHFKPLVFVILPSDVPCIFGRLSSIADVLVHLLLNEAGHASLFFFHPPVVEVVVRGTVQIPLKFSCTGPAVRMMLGMLHLAPPSFQFTSTLFTMLVQEMSQKSPLNLF